MRLGKLMRIFREGKLLHDRVNLSDGVDDEVFVLQKQ